MRFELSGPLLFSLPAGWIDFFMRYRKAAMLRAILRLRRAFSSLFSPPAGLLNYFAGHLMPSIAGEGHYEVPIAAARRTPPLHVFIDIYAFPFGSSKARANIAVSAMKISRYADTEQIFRCPSLSIVSLFRAQSPYSFGTAASYSLHTPHLSFFLFIFCFESVLFTSLT